MKKTMLTVAFFGACAALGEVRSLQSYHASIG